MHDEHGAPSHKGETDQTSTPRKDAVAGYPRYPQLDINRKKVTTSFGKMAPRWAAGLGALAIGFLYAFLPESLTIGPSWLLLALEVPFILIPIIGHFSPRKLPHKVSHAFAFITLGIVTIALAGGVVLLVVTLPGNKAATQLLRSAIIIWLLNVLVFALWYWELDGGGPLERHLAGHQAADFLFPQQSNGNSSGWAPHFIDYLFLGFTGATAFSPTDTLPLTHMAKVLMMVEALISMLIVLILAGRAVNIL